MIEVAGVAKSFTLHNQGGAVIPVLEGAGLQVAPGECVALTGASGCGKSTLMRMIYGNYLVQGGSILVGGLEVAGAEPRAILKLRRERLGYVSQFLRVVPRVPTIEVVAEPCLAVGMGRERAQSRARTLLTRLRIPETLWSLSPLTFSGGEQQRVNIARGFAHAYPAMLLDEPTASLDEANCETVLELIGAAKARGAAIIGIFHDRAVRARLADREVDVSRFAPRRSDGREQAAGQPVSGQRQAHTLAGFRVKARAVIRCCQGGEFEPFSLSEQQTTEIRLSEAIIRDLVECLIA